MNDNGIILYVHGMGGGADSRIPSILRECFNGSGAPTVIVRTYDFDPEKARTQLEGWVDELEPVMLVGESLGAVHALSLRNSILSRDSGAGFRPAILPVILVSPALNAPAIFSRLAFLTFIPGVCKLLGKIYKPRPGERQKLEFRFSSLRKWKRFRDEALSCAGQGASDIFAFFGKRDHYRRSGTVSVRLWRRVFGEDSYRMYSGSHFMEEEYVKTMLVSRIMETLRQVIQRQVGNNADLC